MGDNMEYKSSDDIGNYGEKKKPVSFTEAFHKDTVDEIKDEVNYAPNNESNTFRRKFLRG